MNILVRRRGNGSKEERKIQSEIARGTEGLWRYNLVRVIGMSGGDGQKSVSLAGWLARWLAGWLAGWLGNIPGHF
jgi:hypothetical protein